MWDAVACVFALGKNTWKKHWKSYMFYKGHSKKDYLKNVLV